MSNTKDDAIKLLRFEDWIGNIANLPGFISYGPPHPNIGLRHDCKQVLTNRQGKEHTCERKSWCPFQPKMRNVLYSTLALSVGGVTSDSFRIRVPARGAAKLMTSGSSATPVTGWAYVSTSPPVDLNGNAVFIQGSSVIQSYEADFDRIWGK
jgi:hypothetical protein